MTSASSLDSYRRSCLPVRGLQGNSCERSTDMGGWLDGTGRTMNKCRYGYIDDAFLVFHP